MEDDDLYPGHDSRVVVRIEDREASWSPTEGFSGDEDMVMDAWQAASSCRLVEINRGFIRAEADHAVGAAVALFASDPYQAQIVQAHPEVREIILGEDTSSLIIDFRFAG